MRLWPLILAAALLGAAAPDVLTLGPFSRHPGELPPGWAPLTFPKIERHTRYSVVDDAGTPVVLAESERSASGLMVETRVDVAEYPTLRWRWKVENLIEGSDPTQRSGDDYPARVYLVFDKDPASLPFGQRLGYRVATLLYGELPTRALSYIWASDGQRGEIYPSPYTDFAWLVVARSGREQLGEWVSESRDVGADYERAFGEAAPPLVGVAIMTDSDDTGQRARAYYGDISLERASRP